MIKERVKDLIWKLKASLSDAILPLICGIIGAFIGMAIAKMIGIL